MSDSWPTRRGYPSSRSCCRLWRPLRCYSGAVRKPNMIFIDANHTYDSVKADIQAWMPLLMDGGIICGHDYDPPNWMGIKRAVDECVPKFRIVPGTTIWSTEGCA